MELPLRGLSPGMGRRPARAAAHPGEPRRLRRWRRLGADQRLARPAPAAAAIARRCIRARARAAARSRRSCSPAPRSIRSPACSACANASRSPSARRRATLAALADNTMFGALAPELVTRRAVVPGAALTLPGGITAELFTVPGKVPLYLEERGPRDRERDRVECRGGDFGGRRAHRLHSRRRRRHRGDEGADRRRRRGFFRRHAVSRRRDDRERHRQQDRPPHGTHADRRRGRLARRARRPRARRIYVHINNTNPILVAGSPERAMVERKGWEIAEDGMEIVL